MSNDDPRPRIAISYYADRGNPIKFELFERLRSWADLELLDPEREHPELGERDLDLYHMARWRPAALTDLERACAAGIPTLNSYAGAGRLGDRLDRSETLRDNGFHVPAFQFGRAEDITLQPPVVVKPRHERGPDGHWLHLVRTGPIEFEGEQFVERYVVPQRSYKIFRVGDRVRTTRHDAADGTPKETKTSRRFVHLTERVAALFELGIFELDIVVHKSLYVVDVNPVVSLEGVADAVEIYDALIQETIRNGASLW
ncbi:hypothetical protein [Haloarcula marina]|uniref:hypothetical protein n=1 Tax=Haloarcula marina TaxID=2961574 RepID=UPI0020B84B20|nr:hypothetical protein [Halomicroarcula marina]